MVRVVATGTQVLSLINFGLGSPAVYFFSEARVENASSTGFALATDALSLLGIFPEEETASLSFGGSNLTYQEIRLLGSRASFASSYLNNFEFILFLAALF